MTTIAEAFNIAVEKISTYSFEILLFISGSLGAAYLNHQEPKGLTRRQKWVTYLFGGVTASFVTPLINEITNHMFDFQMSEKAMAGMGFITGVFGLKGITYLMITYLKRGKNKEEKK